MKQTPLAKLFIDLAQISSPSGKEKPVADFIIRYFKDYPAWKIWVDEAGKKNNCNTGNVYAYLQVNPKAETLMFSAHMDTVQSDGENIVVKSDGKTFKPARKTILGADDKAGVSCLLSIAASVSPKDLKHNLIFFFPTREEAGVMGSKFFNFNKTKIKYVFNVDSSDTPGVFIYKSLGFENFTIKIEGKSAHAAKAYEEGKDAMIGAGKIISTLPIGRNTREGWTLNIGKISGGKGTNVVCDNVVLEGETRAFSSETMKKTEKKISDVCQEVSKKMNLTVRFEIDKDSYIPPFSGEAKSELTDECKRATIKSGAKPIFKESFSTSDANMYSGKSYKVISVSRGGKFAHSTNEILEIKELNMALKILQELVIS